MSAFTFSLPHQSHNTYTSPQDLSHLSTQERISRACTNAAIEALKSVDNSSDQEHRIPSLYRLCGNCLINDNLQNLDGVRDSNILATSKLLLNNDLHQAYLKPVITKLLLDSTYNPDPDIGKHIESVDLRELSIHSKELSEEALFKLFSLCKSLRHVNMSGTKLGWKASFMKESSKKTYLQLGWVQNLSNRCLEAISANNPHLQQLHLGGGENIQDSGVQAIAKNCKELTHLDLRSCRLLTDKTLFSLSRACPELQVLNIDWIKKITSSGLITLAERASKLEVFSARSCESLSDSGIIALVEKCPKLSYLDLTYCSGISDDCISAILSSNLKHINVSGCHQLSESSIRSLQDNIPNIVTGREQSFL